jgi:protein-disulfide isomerase
VKKLRTAAALAAAAVALVAAAKVDWTQRVSQTAAGSYVLGNPAAPRKLVEYASYTCSHCAHFSGEATAPLRKLVATGKVSVEFRHALRDRLDLTAALLARCAGGPRFFAASEAIFAAQDDWLQKGVAYETANAEKVSQAGPVDGAKLLARETGLITLIGKFGVTPQKADQCLADSAQAKILVAQTNEAWDTRKIPGTPHFLVNGTSVDANGWAALAPRLSN